MSALINSYIKYLLFLSILIFFALKNLGLDYIDSVSWAVSISIFIFILYESYFWRLNPFCKTPRIYGEYDVKIMHQYNGGGEIIAQAEITQSLFSITVILKTDEMTSYSSSANITEEDNSYVLYYTYTKRPKGRYEDKNPITYGTCRLVLEKSVQVFANSYNSQNIYSELKKWIFKPVSEPLEGIYWTSRKTNGDIIFTKRL